MNTKIFALSALTAASLLSGCVGTGPNTQQGAVTGGALGALAGAIIGHNSGGGNTLGGALIGGTVGAIAGGTIGNSTDQQNGTVYEERQTRGYVRQRSGNEIPVPPPTPQETAMVTAPPAPNALWVPGYWNYDGYRYSWITSHWEIPPPSASAFVVAHWEVRGRGYAFVPSYWR